MNPAALSLRRCNFTSLHSTTSRVFHDEIDLPPGKVRVKVGGGIAGHNGLALDLRAYRQRLSPRTNRRRSSGRQGYGVSITCSAISPRASGAWVEALLGILADNVDLLVRGEDASFQNKVHLAMVAKGFGDK